MKSTITAIVLTLNEELNIIDCLKSISLFDRVIVLDSGSSDLTIPLSREFGAELYIHKPKGTFLFSDQRNWALDNCSINTDWVLFIDADERISKSLYQELRAISNHPSSEHINGFYLRVISFSISGLDFANITLTGILGSCAHPVFVLVEGCGSRL